MFSVQFNNKKCVECIKCKAAAACKMGALIQLDPGDPPTLLKRDCHGCGDCVPICEGQAFSMD